MNLAKPGATVCEIFISADPDSYASRTRSVRLHGVVTSIRLENLYWDVLVEIGARDGMTVVLVEHNMRLVMEVSDRVLVLERGGPMPQLHCSKTPSSWSGSLPRTIATTKTLPWPRSASTGRRSAMQRTESGSSSVMSSPVTKAL